MFSIARTRPATFLAMVSILLLCQLIQPSLGIGSVYKLLNDAKECKDNRGIPSDSMNIKWHSVENCMDEEVILAVKEARVGQPDIHGITIAHLGEFDSIVIFIYVDEKCFRVPVKVKRGRYSNVSVNAPMVCYDHGDCSKNVRTCL